jgi:hypothetical protein
VCALGASGCSLDFAAVSFCASEQQSVSIGSGSDFTSSQTAVSVAVGDSVRLVAHGFCQGAGLHVVIATSGVRWRSRDESIVRIAPAADGAATRGELPATVWAVGLARGSTVVAADAGGSAGSVIVTVYDR